MQKEFDPFLNKEDPHKRCCTLVPICSCRVSTFNTHSLLVYFFIKENITKESILLVFKNKFLFTKSLTCIQINYISDIVN